MLLQKHIVHTKVDIYLFIADVKYLSCLYRSTIYISLCNQWLSPHNLWVKIMEEKFKKLESQII
jgi:hypothetical protein